MLTKQLRQIALPLALAVFVIVVVFAVALLLAQATNTPPARFTRDPQQIAQLSPFAGLVSNLGILLWMTSVATCLFTAGLLRRMNRRDFWFFLAFGLFSLYLTLDDFLVIHEAIHRYIAWMTETVFTASQVALVLALMVLFRRRILKTPFILLTLALLFLGASTGIDNLMHHEVESIESFIEDSLKFAGITLWAAYFMSTAYYSVTPLLHVPKDN